MYHLYRRQGVAVSQSFTQNNSIRPSSEFINLTIFTEILIVVQIYVGWPRHCRVFTAFLNVTWGLLFSCRNYTYEGPPNYQKKRGLLLLRISVFTLPCSVQLENDVLAVQSTFSQSLHLAHRCHQ